MGRLFSDEYKFAKWIDVELAVMKAWADVGRVPLEAYERAAKRARVDAGEVAEFEKTTNHDVVAFLQALAKSVGDDAKFIHLGLTSSDIVDTAQSLVLLAAIDQVDADLAELIVALHKLAVAHRDTVMIGRTHGQHAEPTTFGLKMALFYDEFVRHLTRLRAAREEIAVGKISGSVGNYAHVPVEVEAIALARLGLKPAAIASQIISRDRHAFLLAILAIIASSLDKAATELRELQRTEIAEVMEPFALGQTGSSSMPHKRNPVTLERICGLSRVVRANAIVGLENVATWHERDISHSSAERVVFADSFIALDYTISKMTYVVSNLVVYPKQMAENLKITHGLIFSQSVLMALLDAGMGRDEAYDIVQKNSLKAVAAGTNLLDLLIREPAVARVLDRRTLGDCFTYDPYVKSVGAIYARLGLTGHLTDLESPHAAEAEHPREPEPAVKPAARTRGRKPTTAPRRGRRGKPDERPVPELKPVDIPVTVLDMEPQPAVPPPEAPDADEHGPTSVSAPLVSQPAYSQPPTEENPLVDVEADRLRPETPDERRYRDRRDQQRYHKRGGRKRRGGGGPGQQPRQRSQQAQPQSHRRRQQPQQRRKPAGETPQQFVRLRWRWSSGAPGSEDKGDKK
jgi:adenylosuccinate lyase